MAAFCVPLLHRCQSGGQVVVLVMQGRVGPGGSHWFGAPRCAWFEGQVRQGGWSLRIWNSEVHLTGGTLPSQALPGNKSSRVFSPLSTFKHLCYVAS